MARAAFGIKAIAKILASFASTDARRTSRITDVVCARTRKIETRGAAVLIF
jgi:hypothetical protein